MWIGATFREEDLMGGELLARDSVGCSGPGLCRSGWYARLSCSGSADLRDCVAPRVSGRLSAGLLGLGHVD